MTRFLLVILLLCAVSVNAAIYVDTFKCDTLSGTLPNVVYLDGYINSAAATTVYNTETTMVVKSIGNDVSYDIYKVGYMTWESIGSAMAAGRTVDSARLYFFIQSRTSNFGVGNATVQLYRSMQYMVSGQTTWNAVSSGCNWSTAGAQDIVGTCEEQGCSSGPDIAPASGCGTYYWNTTGGYTEGAYSSFLITQLIRDHKAFTYSELGGLIRVNNGMDGANEFVSDTVVIRTAESGKPPYLIVWSSTPETGASTYRQGPLGAEVRQGPTGASRRSGP